MFTLIGDRNFTGFQLYVVQVFATIEIGLRFILFRKSVDPLLFEGPTV